MVWFEIAGIAIEVQLEQASSRLAVSQRLAGFRVDRPSDSSMRATVHLRHGDPDTVPLGELEFDPGEIWRMYRHGADPHRQVARIAYPGPAPGKLGGAALAANEDWSEVHLVEEPGADTLLALGAGELLVRTRILFADGVVLHAAGIDYQGQGLLLVGHAGAGKSTQALLWEAAGAIGLSDDRVAVRLHECGPVIYGTPWGGTADIGLNRQVPLRAIFVLAKAPHNALEQLTPAEAALRLLPRTFLPYWNRALLGRAISIVGRLAELVPTCVLHCRPEQAAVDLVRSWL